MGEKIWLGLTLVINSLYVTYYKELILLIIDDEILLCNKIDIQVLQGYVCQEYNII